MKYLCGLIKDILPLYHDSICSEESKCAVEEHLRECPGCKQYYDKMCGADIVEEFSYDNEAEQKKADALKNVKKRMKKKTILGIILGAIVGGAILYLAIPFIAVGLLMLSSYSSKVEVHTDISEYKYYMAGEDAHENYQSKWGMDETIFPESITSEMDVLDYKMVYYNPWDAQYLGYLVVEYDEADYEEEVLRLKEYESTEYLGNYGVTGFDEQYTLLAMYADEYQGFVYALTDNEDTIIYVELIFCNYFMDLEYEKYMPAEYFPVGFDATSDNPYKDEMLKNTFGDI